MRSIGCLLLLAVASALATGSAAADGGPAPGALLGWDGVRAPGGAVRYVALPGGVDSTTVAVVRVRDGRVLRFNVVAGVLGIPQVAFDGTTDGLSADRRRLVVASNPGPPAAGTHTTMVVLKTRTLGVLRTIRLRGTWSVDALSPDGATIYAIEYRTTARQDSYRVRGIDAATGRVRPGAIVDRREPEAEMRGSPVTRIGAAGMAYTLYARPDGSAFVHALDTRGASAACIELPWREPGNGIWNVRLSIGSGLMHLHEPGVGKLAAVDLRSLRVWSFRRPVST